MMDLVGFGAGTRAPRLLVERMRWLLDEFTEHPELLEEACGIRGAARHLFDRYVSEEGKS